MRLMGQSGDGDNATVAKIGIVKGCDSYIFGQMISGPVEFLDKPVGNFVVVADHGSTVL